MPPGPKKPIKNILDKWLEQVPSVACYTEKLKVYAPTCHNQCLDAVNELVGRINQLFGGSTTYEVATGCWWDKDNKEMVCEPVKVIEVGHNCQEKEELEQLAKAIIDYAEKANQEYVSIHNRHFYIAQHENLLKAYEGLKEGKPW